MKRALLTFMMLFAANNIVLAGDFEDGLEAYERNLYARAYAKFMQAAIGPGLVFDECLAKTRSDNSETPGDKAGWSCLVEDILREGNRPTAMFYLGVMSEKGQGVVQDYEQALRWYKYSAASGNDMAVLNLAVALAQGRNVPKDYQEAVRWYAKAAEGGNASAQYILSCLYHRGKAVTQDYVIAYMWANLAVSNGDMDATEKRNEIARDMTPGQIAEAQRLARQWKPTTGTVPDRLQGTNGKEPTVSGTGFVVSRQGHVLTNHHVVEKCRAVRVTTEGRKQGVTVLGTDAENDLALLQLPAPVQIAARFREGRTIRPGDGVVVVGFPLPGLLATEAQVTTGTVSALAGIGNNTRYLQISAPVQPGNSGGPLLDQSGNIVGVVVSKLNALAVAKTTGDIPQNINFAINGAVAKAFLDSQSVEYETGVSSRAVETAEIGATARKFALLLECYR